MDITGMRALISKVYSGKWVSRVANMPDNQVIAVYRSFLSRGIFDKKIEEDKKTIKEKGVVYEQITFFDILKEKQKEMRKFSTITLITSEKNDKPTMQAIIVNEDSSKFVVFEGDEALKIYNTITGGTK